MAPRKTFYASPLPEFHNAHLLNPAPANPRGHIEIPTLGSNEHTMRNYNASFRPNTANSRSICDNYHHPAFTVGSHQNMPHQSQNAPYCYNHNVNQSGATMVYPPTENSRTAFKRKTPAHPMLENPYADQFTASSSNFPAPSNHFHLKPIHPNGSAHRYQDETLLSVGEEYQRNVRTRHNIAPQADPNTNRQSSSSRIQLFHSSSSSMSTATIVGGQRHHTSLPGPYSQWNHPSTAHAGLSNYPLIQPVSRNSAFGGNTEQNSAWNSDNSRNSYSNARGTWGGPASYDQRLVLNWTSSNYTNLAASQDNGPPANGSVSSSRIPRPTNLPRSFNAGWPTVVMGNARRGWTSRGFSMAGVPYSAYALNLLDEHSDMRLDIDNMSYEELLVLEETIGNVNTGLPEDHLSSCLTEQIYYCSSTSTQGDQEEARCPICLEEFKDKDVQGVLKCKHGYHVTCIKKWLGLKKTCPVCKAPALEDDAKQKQKVSL